MFPTTARHQLSPISQQNAPLMLTEQLSLLLVGMNLQLRNVNMHVLEDIVLVNRGCQKFMEQASFLQGLLLQGSAVLAAPLLHTLALWQKRSRPDCQLHDVFPKTLLLHGIRPCEHHRKGLGTCMILMLHQRCATSKARPMTQAHAAPEITPTSSTLSPPSTLDLDLLPSTFYLKPSTVDLDVATLCLLPLTLGLLPSTFYLRPSTFYLLPSAFCLLPSTFYLYVYLLP